MKERIQRAAERLSEVSQAPARVFVGFDGYVDTIQFLVKKSDTRQKTFFPDIADFAHHLGGLAGRSGQVEVVTQGTKAGGNGPIMAGALAALGLPATCMGTLGYPELHPVFRPLETTCRLISVGPAAESHAFEFGDGKIIFSELSTFDGLHWQHIRSHAPWYDQLQQEVAGCRLCAFVDWANLPHATALWRGISTDLLPALPVNDRIFFFDLCDPAKKSAADVREVLEVLAAFTACGTTVLGLNENETIGVFEKLLNQRFQHNGPSALESAALRLFEALSIDLLLVHPTDRAFVVSTHGLTAIQGRVVDDPLVLTGAGDNFNAGFAYGLLHGLELDLCLLIATAASGSYVQHGQSPSLQALVEYLRLWAGEL